MQVYRPLVERADTIDRERAEAQERVQAVEAELGRERFAVTAIKQEAVDLRAALDRKQMRLAEAEAEVST